jgi:hypothetical protein
MRSRDVSSAKQGVFHLRTLIESLLGSIICQEIRVVLFGTGNPPSVMNRFGPSILVEAGDENFYLILVATRYSASRKSH